MKYLKTYKLFESSNDVEVGDIVKIRFSPTGEKDLNELVDVIVIDIIPTGRTKRYLVSFKVENNPFFNCANTTIGLGDILGVTQPMSRPALSDKPIKSEVGKISNDLVINGYPKSL